MEICYQDDYLVAINKPHGLLVHRSRIADDVTEFALQKLRNILGKYVYPAHRLDRKTSGLLLFSFNPETNRLLHQAFMQREIKRTYHAVVRGYIDDEGIIDYPLKNENGKIQDAITHYKCLYRAELNIPSGKFQTSRYSLAEIKPLTGRMHQIRKHFAHIFHPIIGDRPYGCNKQNKIFLEQWNHNSLLLHALSIELIHPVSQLPLTIKADYQNEFRKVLKIMDWPTSCSS